MFSLSYDNNVANDIPGIEKTSPATPRNCFLTYSTILCKRSSSVTEIWVLKRTTVSKRFVAYHFISKRQNVGLSLAIPHLALLHRSRRHVQAYLPENAGRFDSEMKIHIDYPYQ